MKYSGIVKAIVSLPVIFVCMYFLPVLGIILALVRMLIYYNKQVIDAPIVLIIVGAVIYIPTIVGYILNNIAHTDTAVLETLLSNDLYKDLSSKASFFIIAGVILIVVSYVFAAVTKKASDKAVKYVSDYITESERKDNEAREKAAMKMAEKRETAKNTHVMKCPKCGSSNMFVGKTTRCVHCRTHIEWTE